MHRDLHGGQVLIHFEELDSSDDLEELKQKADMFKKQVFVSEDYSVQFRLKVVDFGRSRKAKQKPKVSNVNPRKYRAPSVAITEYTAFESVCRPNKAPDLFSSEYTFTVDVFNVGTIAYELLTGIEFNWQSPEEKFKAKVNYTKELRDFIELTTVEDGTERIEIELLKDHPFLKTPVNA